MAVGDVKSDNLVRIETESDRDILLACLNEQNVEYFEPKGDVATIIVALGGGIGMAAIMRSVAAAIREYFKGRTKLAQAQTRKLKITISGKTVEVTASNAGRVESQLLSNIGVSE